MGSKRGYETIERQWMLLKLMTHHKKGTKHFQQALAAEGFEVTLRTIQRDLNGLSRFFPLLNDEEKIAGWSWSEDAQIFDIPGMSSHTALVFKMIKLHLRKMLPVYCIESLQPYFKKAETVLKEREQPSEFMKWPDKIARISRYLTLEAPKIDHQVLKTVYEGLLSEHQLEISYKNRQGNSQSETKIHPLGLVHVDNVAYLVCTFWNYDKQLKIALHRIISAKLLDDKAQIPAGFSLDEYINRSWYSDVSTNQDLIQLECLFDKDVAVHLDESPLASGQILEKYDENYMKLSAEVKNSMQLRWWLMGFGDLVTVLKPENLRNEIKNTLTSALKQYNST